MFKAQNVDEKNSQSVSLNSPNEFHTYRHVSIYNFLNVLINYKYNKKKKKILINIIQYIIILTF